MEKVEVPPRVAAIPHAMVLPKPQNNRPVEEKCTWGLHCPICKKEDEEGTEDWNGDTQESQQRNHCPQNPWHPQTYHIPDRYLQQIRLQKEWHEENGAFKVKNTIKTIIPAQSLYSEFEPEHKYETLT